uniref:Uncharacterized protein n=1 Tax=Myotis myotis TaxID=51298 RepID=A0A7J7SR64_MYOMY|nr:hypothetical protein mMyoMyo1_009305 [Myotis myotis]
MMTLTLVCWQGTLKDWDPELEPRYLPGDSRCPMHGSLSFPCLSPAGCHGPHTLTSHCLRLPGLLQRLLTSRDWETGRLPNQLPFLASTGGTICDFWVRRGSRGQSWAGRGRGVKVGCGVRLGT